MMPDGSVVDHKGRITLFSLHRFISEIATGDHCFICGAKPGTAPFNDEHVLPDWILKRYKLHDKTITIPNNTGLRYGQMKIPCCVECNSTMGSNIEKPMSEMFSQGTEGLSSEFKKYGPWRLFMWMSLIFLKTHLKDKNLSFCRDKRKGDAKIAEFHSWEDLHHLHCIARAFYTGCNIAAEVAGSLLVLPAKVRPHFESFDYGDLSLAQTMLLRLDDVAIIAVFNDSQAALQIYSEELKRLDGPLSPLQLREIAARLASINIQLSERPRFFSEFDRISGEYKIVAYRPEVWQLENWQHQIHGAIMHHICQDLVVGVERDVILSGLKTGRYTFLLDKRGSFLRDHMELLPD
ncbi:MAG TPA: hypothetical protein VNK82_03035 [Terriglobales bacterium]|nr:hypothetical protein [Terriglobales bacterium]